MVSPAGEVKQMPQDVVWLFGKLTSSLNQLMFKQEARLILCFGRHHLPETAMLHDKVCISQKMCTGHHWFDRMVAYFLH